jgi:hypothetical protein
MDTGFPINEQSHKHALAFPQRAKLTRESRLVCVFILL